MNTGPFFTVLLKAQQKYRPVIVAETVELGHFTPIGMLESDSRFTSSLL